jgi:hypothetical protein
MIISSYIYNVLNKMKNKNYQSIKVIVTNTQIHGRSLSWLGTGTLVRRGGATLVLWTEMGKQ